jgi:hypothetical protein
MPSKAFVTQSRRRKIDSGKERMERFLARTDLFREEQETLLLVAGALELDFEFHDALFELQEDAVRPRKSACCLLLRSGK